MSFVLRDLGPAKVIIDPDGTTPVDLGDVNGSIEFKDEVKKKDIKTEAAGETAVDAVFTGREVTLKVPMTRAQLSLLAAVIPGSVLATSILTVSNKVGSPMYASAKKVTIKPIVDGVVSTTESEWLTIFKAFPVASPSWKYDASNQRVCDVTFYCFPSQETGAEGQIYAIGE